MGVSISEVRVLVGDGREGERLAHALERDPELVVCARVCDPAGAVQAAGRVRPVLCLLEARTPSTWIPAIREIVARIPETKVVIITNSRDDHDLFAVLRAGASGYLLEDEVDLASLPGLLRAALDGDTLVAPALIGRLVEEFRERLPRRRKLLFTHEPGEDLTSREWQVLELMQHDLSTAEMAERLFVSPVTVRRHVASILKKLHLPDWESARHWHVSE